MKLFSPREMKSNRGSLLRRDDNPAWYQGDVVFQCRFENLDRLIPQNNKGESRRPRPSKTCPISQSELVHHPERGARIPGHVR